MKLEICVANNNDADEWDRIISQSPNGTLFHQWNWLKIAEKYTSTTLYPLIGMKNGTPMGVFPLFFQKKGPLRMVFSPPPHASLFYLGPVFIGVDNLKQEKWETVYCDFQKSMEEFINTKLKPNYIRISLSPTLQDPRPFSWAGYSVEPNFDYTIDLTKGIDFLYKSLDRKQRSSLKRAKEKGMVFEIGTKKECEIIFDLMETRYAQQAKIITVNRDYFLDIYDAYKNYLKIFVVRLGEEILTGSIRFHYRDTLYGWVGNPKPKIPITPSPNHFLFWETIRFASENGIKNYTTMSAAGNKRLHVFYAERLNPELKIHYIVSKKSAFAKISEAGYRDILKPIRGRIKHLAEVY
jgi:hypothetical protein